MSTDGIFSSRDHAHRRQDWRLFYQAVRNGWLTDEKLAEIQCRAADLALVELETGDVEEFCRLVTVVEQIHQHSIDPTVKIIPPPRKRRTATQVDPRPLTEWFRRLKTSQRR
ncbi:MAG: hypothetical protein V4719_02455 [Planctomycetota bacterium]